MRDRIPVGSLKAGDRVQINAREVAVVEDTELRDNGRRIAVRLDTGTVRSYSVDDLVGIE